MAQIQDVPVELLRLIFKNIYLTSRVLRYPERYESEEENDENFVRIAFRHCMRTFPPEMTWNDASTRSPAKFPFNVSNTCKLWRDVALSSPEHWVDVQFDLAQDPTPLLDAFSASRDILFSVVVFTTANDRTDQAQTLEKDRTLSIVQHLLPHMNRCVSVVFDLTFASSLPSAISFLVCDPLELTELVLDYQVYDLPSHYEAPATYPESISSPPKKLVKLSMHGSEFMNIIHLGIKWLQALKTGREQAKTDGMNLHLRDFQFPASKNDTTFLRFIHLLHFFNPSSNLCLEKISMAYRPHSGTGPAEQYNLSETSWSSLTFKNVSKDFIVEFFQKSDIGMVEGEINFVSCSVPFISGSFLTPNLNCTDVPASVPSFAADDDSLYNIISSWNGTWLSFTECPALDDKFIDWLATNGENGVYEACGIKFIDLEDCSNFSAAAIRRLVAAANDPAILSSQKRPYGYGMSQLNVCGDGPQLLEEDMTWFEGYIGETTVRWQIQNGEGVKPKTLEFKGKRKLC